MLCDMLEPKTHFKAALKMIKTISASNASSRHSIFADTDGVIMVVLSMSSVKWCWFPPCGPCEAGACGFSIPLLCGDSGQGPGAWLPPLCGRSWKSLWGLWGATSHRHAVTLLMAKPLNTQTHTA